MSASAQLASRRDAGGWTVVDLFGEIDFGKSRELRAFVDPLVKGGTKLLFNLAGVNYMDSTALATLVACRRQLAESSGSLRICCLTPRVQSLISITRLDRVFEIFKTEDEAIK